jgi:microcystin-dependent protein
MSVPNIYPSYITDGANPAVELSGGVSNPFPTGIIIFHASLTIPSGWLACSGTSVPKASYPNLYSLLGPNAFGTDTSTNFFLPNFIDLFPVGVSGTKALNATGGNTTHVHGNVAISTTTSNESLVHDHTTTFGNPDHSHSNTNAPNHTVGDGAHYQNINAGATNSHTSGISGNTGNLGGQDSPHAHGVNGYSTNGDGAAAHNYNGVSTNNISSGTTSHNHSITNNSVTSHSHTGSHPTSASTSGTHTPPFLVVQFIIKT